MPYKREIFEKAQEILDKRRNQAEAKNTAVMMMFENTEPLYREYKNEMIASVKGVYVLQLCRLNLRRYLPLL